jgi:malate dehydrogenase (oxaloacetate-decarboxylating)
MLVDDGLVVGDRGGDIARALEGSDIFIGVAKPGLVDQDMVRSMNDNPIVFAMSNPVPEIMPDEAASAGAAVVATGRSDFPNQINNALVFPGIFRGALDNRGNAITADHKIAAAEAVAKLVDDISADQIIPSIFDERLVPTISKRITPPAE